MKNIAKMSVVAIILALFASSCQVRYVDSRTGQPIGQQGSGQQVIGQERVANTTVLRAFVKLGADAPQDVVQRAEEATANEVGYLYAKSFESGGKPRWPNLSTVTSVAGQKLAANGHRLSPGSPGQPGCFKVMEYRPGVE
jgi:hypothetical protein